MVAEVREDKLSGPLRTQLIEGCRHCLSQCELLLNLVSEDDFVARVGSASVGTHVRHVLDRFQSFFNGLPAGHIDYDSRNRDPQLETSLPAARVALASFEPRIGALASGVPGPDASVSVQDCVYHNAPPVTLGSNIDRELMGLISHTTHHLAILVLLLRPLGYELDPDFGKAPSTIRFERSRRAQ